MLEVISGGLLSIYVGLHGVGCSFHYDTISMILIHIIIIPNDNSQSFSVSE